MWCWWRGATSTAPCRPRLHPNVLVGGWGGVGWEGGGGRVPRHAQAGYNLGAALCFIYRHAYSTLGRVIGSHTYRKRLVRAYVLQASPSKTRHVHAVPAPCAAPLATGKPIIYDTVDLHFLREARTAMGEQMSAPEATRRAQVRMASRAHCKVAPKAQAGEALFEVVGLRW